jgi:hypothetical protein
MTRTILPQRRPHEAISFVHWQQRFHAGLGRDHVNGPILEVWINTGKSGTQAETYARDAAVLISLGLQYGVPLSVMRRAIMRDLDGAASGPIGKLLDLIDDGAAESETVLPNAPVTGPSVVEPAI